MKLYSYDWVIKLIEIFFLKIYSYIIILNYNYKYYSFMFYIHVQLLKFVIILYIISIIYINK